MVVLLDGKRYNKKVLFKKYLRMRLERSKIIEIRGIYMYEFNSRVRYSEVNSEKKLTLPALLDYLQDCCSFQGEDLGIGIEYLEKEHVAWVLSSWEIEIVRYPQLGERIVVGTWPYEFKGFYGMRNFLIKDEYGEVLAKANSVWVFMDTNRMRPTRILDHVVESYRDKIEEQLAGEWGARKLAIPENGRTEEMVQVARCHIDTNHHMNNAKYVQVAEEYLPEQFVVKRLRVEYKKSAMLGDTLTPKVTEDGDKVSVVLEDEADKPCAVVEFICG